MNTIAYILSATLSAGFIVEAFTTPLKSNGVAVQMCSGKTIFLDLGPLNPDPKPPHKLKPCHAICCSDEEDGSSNKKQDS